jgi:hypothetical protein
VYVERCPRMEMSGADYRSPSQEPGSDADDPPRMSLLTRAAGITLTVMGWWLVLVIVIVLPYVLAQFDYTHSDVIGGLLVLILYVGVVVALALLLMRYGRRLRAK